MRTNCRGATIVTEVYKGTRMPTKAKGTIVSTKLNGTRIPINADGTNLAIKLNGSEIKLHELSVGKFFQTTYMGLNIHIWGDKFNIHIWGYIYIYKNTRYWGYIFIYVYMGYSVSDIGGIFSY